MATARQSTFSNHGYTWLGMIHGLLNLALLRGPQGQLELWQKQQLGTVMAGRRHMDGVRFTYSYYGPVRPGPCTWELAVAIALEKTYAKRAGSRTRLEHVVLYHARVLTYTNKKETDALRNEAADLLRGKL